MSERDYFSLRYTVPGFVLIFLIIGLNYGPMYNILTSQGITDVTSLAISILTLFASSAIGFLISQVWFFIFHSRRSFARILEEDNVEEYMHKAFGWKKKEPKQKNNSQRDAAMGAVIDYILNKEDEKFLKFFQRKIDLYHTMSCTCISLSAGLIIGEIVRGIAIDTWSGYCIQSDLDRFLFIFTIISGLFFFCIFIYLRKKIFVEYHPMLKLILNNLAAQNKPLKENIQQVFGKYIEIERTIRKLRKDEKIPYDLLLLADETVEAINKYIFNSEIYVLKQDNKTIALYALQVLSKSEVEIKNIAVQTEFQGQGIGKLLLKDAADRAKARGFKTLIIGTGDVATKQLHLYEKEGFVRFAVKKNFFVENYPKPIYENGKQLKDMIMLKKELKP